MLAFFHLSSFIEKPTLLERIKKNGELKVLTRYSPGIYYEDPYGLTGFEYDLLKRFSDSLGVKLTIVTELNTMQLLDHLATHNAHFAAANLAITPKRQQRFYFSQAYHETVAQLIYHMTTRRPRTQQAMEGISIEISANDSIDNDLKELKKTIKKLDWHINKEESTENLIHLVAQRLIDFTIVSSDEIKLNQRFYPEIRVAFDIGNTKPVGWAFAKTKDISLLRAANKFIQEQKANGGLEQLRDQYFGHIYSFDYVDIRAFKRHILTRLPDYQPWFEKAGKDNNIEWVLLASMSYQESHWKEDAKSPTGVRGLMMLTLNTAKYIGINNRVEPHQSIFGGSYYFAILLKKIPKAVTGRDRIFFALASYNLGYWHVRDAMELTKKNGMDENKWINLKQTLPLLRKKKWYKQTRFGYARGDEAVDYVEKIRSYYDILKWEVSRSWSKASPDKTIKALHIDPAAL